MNVSQQRREIISFLVPELLEDSQHIIEGMLEKEFPFTLRFAVLAEQYRLSGTNTLQMHVVEAKAISKEKITRSYEKHGHEIVFTFEPGEKYTVNPLTVYMTRKAKGSKKFEMHRVSPLSVRVTGQPSLDVLRSYNITDYPDDHPIFEAIKKYNEPLLRYVEHRELAKKAESEFLENFESNVKGIRDALDSRPNKKQRTG